MIVHRKKNICRVFIIDKELPLDLSDNRPIDVLIRMVDWFNPLEMERPMIVMGDPDIRVYREEAVKFIKRQSYYDPKEKYLAITDFNDSFVISPTK